MDTHFPSRAILIRALKSGACDAGRLLPEAANPANLTRHAEIVASAEARARAALGKPIPPLPWSVFRLFHDTGDRTAFERLLGARNELLTCLKIVLLADRDSDGAFAALLEDLLWEICNEYTWSLPAHLMYEYAGKDGFREDCRHIDLRVASLGLTIAEILHFLGNRLSPRIVARCRAELRSRILDNYLGPWNAFWWEDGRNNWAAVCAGCVGGVFLYEERDASRLKIALQRVLDTLELYIDSFPDDAACEEGPGYWSYGFGHFAVFAELLYEYTGGAYDLFQNPEVHAIAAFPQGVRLTPTRAVSFADSHRHYRPPRALSALLHRHYPDIATGDAPDIKAYGHGQHHLRELLWCEPGATESPLPDATTYLPVSQWLVVRRAPFAFAALFGSNGVSHNHNDVGSFLLVDGDREGPMDLGTGLYNKTYFGRERYGDEIFCCGSQGHSVPIVRGTHQQAGRDHAAHNVRCETQPDGTIVFSGDIAGAYELPALRSLRRTFTVRPTEGMTELLDEFAFEEEKLPPTDAPTVERFVGYERAEILAPGRARFGAFEVSFDPALPATVHTHPFRVSGSTVPTDVFLLDIELPSGRTSFRATFTR